LADGRGGEGARLWGVPVLLLQQLPRVGEPPGGGRGGDEGVAGLWRGDGVGAVYLRGLRAARGGGGDDRAVHGDGGVVLVRERVDGERGGVPDDVRARGRDYFG